MYDKNANAMTPPMGWNSYDYYDTTVNEERVLANAEYMAKNLKEYGWEYVVIDIEWFAHKAGTQRELYQYIPFNELEMDEYSRLLPDPERFPSSVNGAGFKPIADKIHAMGLKLGIHIMRGIPRDAAHRHMKIKGSDVGAHVIANPSSISRWNPDMYGVRNCEAGQAYYDSIFELYASWGVDFIKCDDICVTNAFADDFYSGRHEVEMIAKAIEKCGRPMVLSLSPGPAIIEQAWHYESYANMWRITDDFWDDWRLLKDMFRRCEIWQMHVSAGNYPDCDMLTLGKLGAGFGHERDCRFSYDEQKTMMSLWCIFGSPMMIGAELTMLDDKTYKLLTNRELLKLLDPGRSRRQLKRDENEAAWESIDNTTGERVVALFNLSDKEREVSVKAEGSFTEIWDGKSAEAKGELKDTLRPHACSVWQGK
ncbi:MAG: glycoside hydrolase family 27 protein [Lachnospiraceae bacterium]|nr:glycoside hydrolase family 27 protein [Lachnospiraceae bacterium]